MKILVVSSKYPPEYAGSGLRAHDTYRRLSRKLNIEYDVITNSVEFVDDSVYRFEGVRVHRIAKWPGRVAQFGGNKMEKLIYHILGIRTYVLHAPAVIRHITSGGYDLIHTFGDSNSVYTAMYCASRRKIPLIREICNTAPGFHPTPFLPFKLHRVMPFHYTDGSKVVAISKGIADYLIKAGVSPNIIWQRPNPVNERIFYFNDRQRSPLRRELTPFSENDRVILNISKFMPSKNQLFLVDVLARLPKQYKLMLCGPVVSSGPNYKRDLAWMNSILHRIDESGLRSRVFVRVGFINDVAQYYRIADVFAFPTLVEALGTPMLESLACGTPVVANQIPGVTDYWIRNYRGGFVCSSKPDPSRQGYRLNPDVDEFARAIQRAVTISEQTRRDESKWILQIASAKVIDQGYITMFQAMCH